MQKNDPRDLSERIAAAKSRAADVEDLQPASHAALDNTHVRGKGGSLQLIGDRLIIRRSGVLSFFLHGFKGEKEIVLSSITAVQFKDCGALTNGYIQFSIKGGLESKGGIFDAASDENTVVFSPSQESAFRNFKLKLDTQIGHPNGAPKRDEMMDLDYLERLARLKEQGVITEDEFQQKKKKLLGL